MAALTPFFVGHMVVTLHGAPNIFKVVDHLQQWFSTTDVLWISGDDGGTRLWQGEGEGIG